ncbi:MAG: hydrogenase maturation nickel metallochaperone HypA [Coriobacteriia bacterium]|nr:hydrogenase maturation nickel metallochaperone HypA [Coriobacteriia bacterium]
MHEMGIAEGILSSSLDAAQGAGARGITVVYLTIGELTEISEDALHFAWEAIAPGTLAEGSTLSITMVRASSSCADCGHEWEHDRYSGAQCPECGSWIVMLHSGRELKIDSIDIDEEGDA